MRRFAIAAATLFVISSDTCSGLHLQNTHSSTLSLDEHEQVHLGHQFELGLTSQVVDKSGKKIDASSMAQHHHRRRSTARRKASANANANADARMLRTGTGIGIGNGRGGWENQHFQTPPVSHSGSIVDTKADVKTSLGSKPLAKTGCLNGCSGHGSCVATGVCACYVGFFGSSCEFQGYHNPPMARAPPNNSAVLTATATAIASASTCPNDCNNRGFCESQRGMCRCDPGFHGESCELDLCPSNNNGNSNNNNNNLPCSGHGSCLADGCKCHFGYAGLDCASKSCPDDCNRHGFCGNGTCFCFPGYKVQYSPLYRFNSTHPMLMLSVLHFRFQIASWQDSCMACAKVTDLGKQSHSVQ